LLCTLKLLALTAWGPHAPFLRCPSGSSLRKIAFQAKRSTVNARLLSDPGS
jgi:hypothetical protein